MIGREFRFHNGKKGAALAIRMMVGKKANKISKILKDGTVVIDIAGKPKKPKESLIQFLADELELDLKCFDVVEGKEGSDLLLSILDISPQAIQDRIMAKIS